MAVESVLEFLYGDASTPVGVEAVKYPIDQRLDLAQAVPGTGLPEHVGNLHREENRGLCIHIW